MKARLKDNPIKIDIFGNKNLNSLFERKPRQWREYQAEMSEEDQKQYPFGQAFVDWQRYKAPYQIFTEWLQFVKKQVSSPVNDWAPPPKEISPLVSQLRSHQFEFSASTSVLNSKSTITMNNHDIPPQTVKEYCHVLKTHKVSQVNGLPLQEVVNLLIDNFGRDSLQYIPHMTWLLMKVPKLRDTPKTQWHNNAVELMKEYLDNL